VRITIAEVGLDPSIGYLHAGQPERAALVFVQPQTFTVRDFVIDARLDDLRRRAPCTGVQDRRTGVWAGA
jgi:hypothetical protein